jgi:hypothetical protein
LFVSARHQRQRFDPHLDELCRVGGVEHGIHLWRLARVEPTSLRIVLLPRLWPTSVLARERESRKGLGQNGAVAPPFRLAVSAWAVSVPLERTLGRTDPPLGREWVKA